MDFRCCCGRRKKRNCGAYSQIDWDALDLQIWYHYHQLLLTIIILFILLLGIILSVEILTKILNILILFLIFIVDLLQVRTNWPFWSPAYNHPNNLTLGVTRLALSISWNWGIWVPGKVIKFVAQLNLQSWKGQCQR